MVRVYRIENAKGEGPWSGEYSVSHAHLDGGGYGRRNEQHPSEMPGAGTPSERDHFDRLKGLEGEAKENIVFGWRTKTQMRRWFKPYICKLLRERGGYVLNVYEVPEATITWAQATFDRRTAVLIDTLTLN